MSMSVAHSARVEGCANWDREGFHLREVENRRLSFLAEGGDTFAES